MDIISMRSLVTVVGFVAFVALVAYTWSKARRRDHDEAAQLPFADSRPPGQDTSGVQS
jgi:cytochrome c oxidase cbb3-type subunit 4